MTFFAFKYCEKTIISKPILITIALYCVKILAIAQIPTTNPKWYTAQISPRKVCQQVLLNCTVSKIDSTSILSIGGVNEFLQPQTRVDGFNAVSGKWSRRTPLPVARALAGGALLQGRVYIAGGYISGVTASNRLDVYDPQTDQWQVGPPLPVPVGDCASVVMGDSLLYLIGGANSGRDFSVVQVYNVRTQLWATASDKPGKAGGGIRGAGTKQGQLFVAGGYDQTNRQATDEAWVGTVNTQNPAQISWVPFPANPAGTFSRMAMASSPLAGQEQVVYAAGGDPTGRGLEALSQTWLIDLGTHQWKPLPAKPTAASNMVGLAVVEHKDSVFLAAVGGYNGDQVIASHERLLIGHRVTPLPVQLTSFTATYNQNRNLVTLRWHTAQEINNSGFTIEVSADGKRFEQVGRVNPAKGPSSDQQSDYSWQEVWSYGPAARYYRLVQTDIDGSSHYSSIKVISVQADFLTLKVQPMPVDQQAQIHITGLQPGKDYELQVMDNLGRLLFTYKGRSFSTNQKIEFPQNIKPGIYFIIIQNGIYKQQCIIEKI